ncbi:PREDICTED: C-C motif chemokine 21-like, partial [Tinamus guttatus]|uniref:C-C motif chemokine 21-like n=1 Tax=Tinamus guttatus TaxID=94827 RepID=UPI00052F0E8F
ISSQASDCCLKMSQRNIPLSLVRSYSMQGPESGCLLHAVVFTTRKGKKLCASPANPAAQKVMKKLDKKNAQPAAPCRKALRKKGQQP